MPNNYVDDARFSAYRHRQTDRQTDREEEEEEEEEKKKKKTSPFRENLLRSIRPFPCPIQFSRRGEMSPKERPRKHGCITIYLYIGEYK